jgi:hypothetical protein
MKPVAIERHRSTSSLPGLTRQSIALERLKSSSMDARVKPAHDESDSPAADMGRHTAVMTVNCGSER